MSSSNPKSAQWMRDAFQAYQSGVPVVILDKSGSPIHVREELQSIDRLTKCFVVRDVHVDQWNASEWPQNLEAARQVYRNCS